MTFAVAFDFEAHTLERMPLASAPDAIRAGRYCWIDLREKSDVAAALEALGVEAAAQERIDAVAGQSQIHVGRTCIDCTLTEAQARDGLTLKPVHMVLGEGFFLTVHDGESALITGMLETFEADFEAAARSGGFLLFEIFDHLIQGYRDALADLSHAVDDVQRRLLGDIGDEILTDVSELTRDLLEFRNAVVAGREIVNELATRRSPYVSESTQPFLDRLTAPLERLAGDAATERAVLSETLNLYMGIVSHRTNKVVNRLTLVSLIFLPLNFLAAVYGMNFQHMPELGWRYGYFVFWGISLAVAIGLTAWFWRKRWF